MSSLAALMMRMESEGKPSDYAWLITRDLLFEQFGDRSEVGVMGPHNATPEQIARLNGGEGREFLIYDDDGELYYEGRIVGVPDDDSIYTGSLNDSADFGPLWDFGTPNAGATEIHYKNEAGEWQQL